MNLQKLRKFIKHLPDGTFDRLIAIICMLLMFVTVIPHILPHVHATGITVSNLTFDPSTGAIDFDYSGDTLTGNQNIDISNTGGTTVYWDANKGHCTPSHCFGSLVVSTNSDSSVTSVIIQVGVDNSQTLAYPLPLPATNAPQTPSAVGGWTATGDTWTYVSASSFKITGVDRTAIYTPGTRIKATNNGTTFYGTVNHSSFSSDTTVTLIPTTDYSLTNSSITAPFYSYEESPVGYPGFFNYTPTVTGFSSTSTLTGQFYVTGNMITVMYGIYGTSNSTSFIVSTPAQAQFDYVGAVFSTARARDNGTLIQYGAEVYYDASNLRLYKDYSETPWTSSGDKSAFFTVTYRFF